MGWDSIAALIVSYGIPLAEKIWQKASSKAQVTQADWDELKQMASQSASDRMRAQLTAAGISPDSDQGKTLLGLAS